MGGGVGLGSIFAGGAAGGASGGGWLAGLGGMLGDRLVQSLLISAGSDLLANRPGTNTAELLKTTQASKGYADILKAFLGGSAPPGWDMKVNAEGAKITVPNPDVNAGNGGTALSGSTGSYKAQSSPDFQRMFGGLSALNPFVDSQPIPQLSYSDLAGVSPEMISNALQFKMSREALSEKRLSDISDMMYKQGLLEYYASQTEEGRQRLALEQQRIRQTEIDNARQWYQALTKDERTELQKNYDFAQTEEGGGFKGSILDFKVAGGTPTSWDEYRLAKDKEGYKGSYLDFIKTVGEARSQRLTLSEELKRRGAFADLDNDKAAEQFFSKDLPETINKFTQSSGFKRATFLATGNAKEVSNMLIADQIEREIVGRGVDIVGRDVKGNTMVWRVKYPSGAVKDIKFKLETEEKK